MPIRSEKAMKAPVARFLRDHGYDTLYEVPVGSRRVDVAGWKGEMRSLVAVELKISKWVDALRQANFYAHWSDAAYVALPVERAAAALAERDLFDASGVGLLTIERNQCDVRIHPRRRRISLRDPYRVATVKTFEASQ